MATAAYVMTPVTTQRITVRCSPSIFTSGNAATVPSGVALEKMAGE